MYLLVRLALLIVLATVSLFRLDAVPPLWWDEGWTLAVARNWLELGHYGRLLTGQLVPAGLQAAPTLTASVYLSFSLFGIGVIQARMVGVVFSLASLGLLYHLARRIYNQPIALGTVLVLTFLPAYIGLFPVYVGRQVLGEIPAMFFLLAGYVSILHVSRYPGWAVSLAVLFWAMALSTKLQVVPFWSCSILAPISLSVFQRNWRHAFLWALAFVGALLGARLLPIFWGLFLRAKADIADPISGLYEVTGVVWSVPSRMFALIVTVLFGIPTLLGLCYGLWNSLKKDHPIQTPPAQVKLALLFLALSWMAWFVVLSVGWTRYIFPATFIGSIFVAAMIYDLTRGYDVAYVGQQSRAFFKGQVLKKEPIGALLVLVLLATSIPRTAMALYKTYILDADTSVQQTAEFLNSQTPPRALIETYDSELFFLLKRDYHYPPDQVHVDLIRRTFLYDDGTIIRYDPLAANPDYLVVGPHSQQWRLYEPVLKGGAFRLLQSYARYQIYERIR